MRCLFQPLACCVHCNNDSVHLVVPSTWQATVEQPGSIIKQRLAVAPRVAAVGLACEDAEGHTRLATCSSKLLFSGG